MDLSWKRGKGEREWRNVEGLNMFVQHVCAVSFFLSANSKILSLDMGTVKLL